MQIRTGKLSNFITKLPFFGPASGSENSELSRQLATQIFEPNRPNRLCVTISDIHLTDGTVGKQNLPDYIWQNFFAQLKDTCNNYNINDITLILDGDVLDIIRSGLWVKNGIYPWEREREADFSRTVDEITRNIIKQHSFFFSHLKNFDTELKRQCPSIDKTNVVILLGNHDKELLAVNDSLSYFYEHGLGKKLTDFTPTERRDIGLMYGDKNLFMDEKTAPYFPFYFADKGFRYFTTHGQWRDRENCREIKAQNNLPGWSVRNAWRVDDWEKLKFSPFLQPCFGDTVAAGVLSTFIHLTKSKLEDAGVSTARLIRILDELDLYRPSYLAAERILKETQRMRTMKANKANIEAIEIIENMLSQCIMDWLSWDFTYESSPLWRRILLKIIRQFLILMKNMEQLRWLKFLGNRLEIKGIAQAMKIMAKISHYQKKGLSLRKMNKFPTFLPPFSDNGFQIHGEGHTHRPLQEEVNLSKVTNQTYINFGTWRDQIVPRKNQGYRRHSVLRAFSIFDLQAKDSEKSESNRQFAYNTEDIIIWNDELDNIEKSNPDGSYITF